MFRSGATWSLQILIPVQERCTVIDGRRKYEKVVRVKPTVQEEVLEFLCQAPTLIGVGVRSDVTAVQECYSMLSGRKVILLQFLELGALYTVLGWGIGSTKMPGITLLNTGRRSPPPYKCMR